MEIEEKPLEEEKKAKRKEKPLDMDDLENYLNEAENENVPFLIKFYCLFINI